MRITLALALSLIAAPLAAKEKAPVFVETEAVKDKPAIMLDPAKAYILLRAAEPTPLHLMKMPTAADQAAYDRMREAAFVEARAKYARAMVEYEAERKAAAKRPGVARPMLPDRPVEPTAQNFEFTPFGLLAGVTLGPINRFAKAGASTYLQAVTPGTYRVYGLVSLLPGAVPGASCFCMGSVAFDARPGEIVDLGVIPKTTPADRPKGDSSHPGDPAGMVMFADAGADMPLDPRLARFRLVRATFRPVGKLPNYFGVAIRRMPAMPGVMRYDRDRIIDLTAAR